MRKILMILALSAITLMASTTDAFAQRRGGGYGGGRGYGGGGYGGGGYGGGSGFGITIGNGGVRYYSGDNYNRGGYYGGSNYGRGYASPYYYGSGYSSTPYYYGSQYYEAAPIVQQAGYYEPAPVQQPVQQTANVTVHLSRADAKVWFDGAATSQQGMERVFYSPPLENGTYTYTVRAQWTENGQSVTRERRVNVRPGQSATVDFRADSGESLQAPPRSK